VVTKAGLNVYSHLLIFVHLSTNIADNQIKQRKLRTNKFQLQV